MDKIENAPQPSHDTLLVTPAPPALPPEHISAPEPKKSRAKLIIFALIAIILIAIVIIVIVVLTHKSTSTEEPTPTPTTTETPSEEPEEYDEYDDEETGNHIKELPSSTPDIKDYIYKVYFYFGQDTYIYLLKDNTLEVVSVGEMYGIMPDCYCMRSTGKYRQEEMVINFKDEVKQEVIAVIKELAQKAGSNEFNADKRKLTTYQNTVLLATVVNNQDWLTLKKDMVIDRTKKGKVEMDLINANHTDNILVSKAATAINTLVIGDYQVRFQNTNKAVKFRIELIYVGPYYFNMLYYKIDEKGNRFETIAYVFNGTGDLKEFDARGIMDDYHAAFVKAFKKSSYYAKYKNQLASNWEEITEELIFENGNWYQVEGGVNFVFPASEIGVKNSVPSDVTVFIETDGSP